MLKSCLLAHYGQYSDLVMPPKLINHPVNHATYFSSHKDFVLLSRRHGMYWKNGILRGYALVEDVNDVFLRRAI